MIAATCLAMLCATSNRSGLNAVDGPAVVKLVDACRGKLPAPDKDDDEDAPDEDPECPHRKLDKVERDAFAAACGNCLRVATRAPRMLPHLVDADAIETVLVPGLLVGTPDDNSLTPAGSPWPVGPQWSGCRWPRPIRM